MSSVSFRLASSTDAAVLARMMMSLSTHQQEVEKPKDDPGIRVTAASDLEARLAAHSADQGGAVSSSVGFS